MMMRTIRLLLLMFLAPLLVAGGEWKTAQPGWTYEFPRDHWPHPDFKTEWWYFTGHLSAPDGREFGYQITFFRQGVRPPGERTPVTSRYVRDHFSFAHVALTDLREKRFHFQQKISRGAFEESGFGTFAAEGGRVAWVDDWEVRTDASGNYQARASVDGIKLELSFATAKPWTLHGTDGISQKAAGDGHASHYYSGTRLITTGSVTVDGSTLSVTGESWFDHEWATNQLTPEQLGWNWFSIQLDDQTELMLYQMRLKYGGIDPFSSGTFVDRDGKAQHLASTDYTLEPLEYWTSPSSKAKYPVAWRFSVPSLALSGTVRTPMANQELFLAPIAYWEGAIQVAGERNHQPITGKGYMELTGYSGPLVGLSSPKPSER